MKLHLDRPTGRNVITAYRPGAVIVNAVTYSHSLIISPETLITDWPPRNFAALSAKDFSAVIDLDPEIVLLGTGARIQHASAALRAPFTERRIGFECMDTGAACRSYAVLAAESRRVVAALLIDAL